MKNSIEIKQLKKHIQSLEKEITQLKRKVEENDHTNQSLVKTPIEFTKVFTPIEKLVSDYFSKLRFDANKASILIDDERYVLMRASSLSIDFLNKIKFLYSDKGETEAIRIGQNFLFDIAHVIGLEDAKTFHEKLNLKDPISKLSAGPIHFAHSGWANVEIIESKLSANESFYLKYSHPNSFEAESWINKKKESKVPICTMNAGYSSGWCEESFGIPLTSVEISCRGKGDKECVFIMAHPSKIEALLEKENLNLDKKESYDIPLFFERKNTEQTIIKSLEEKSILLKEVHHRVKNNLQLISSLLNLQSHHLVDADTKTMFAETKNRIKAIALVHEKLYQSADVEHVNLKEYLQSIVDLISDSIGSDNLISINANSIVNNKISIDKALPCGLILNELISNALKYAFPKKNPLKNNRILVTVIEKANQHEIIVQDNGIGLPNDFTLDTTNSLGFDIILSLVEQIDGTIDYTSKPKAGSSFLIAFKN